jgi:hypothetical protein
VPRVESDESADAAKEVQYGCACAGRDPEIARRMRMMEARVWMRIRRHLSSERAAVPNKFRGHRRGTHRRIKASTSARRANG